MSEYHSSLSVELGGGGGIMGNHVAKKCKFPAVPLTFSRSIDSGFLLATILLHLFSLQTLPFYFAYAFIIQVI